MKKFMAIFLSLLMIFSLAGCGGNNSNENGVTEFKAAEGRFKLDRWERNSDFDNETSDGYSLVFLSTIDSIPVQFTLGSDSTPMVLLVADVIVDGTAIQANGISASYGQYEGGYSAEILYSFSLPKGSALPSKGVLHDMTADKDIDLDLSGLELK